MTNTKQEWIKRFDEKFPDYFDGAYYEKEDANLGDELKTFITAEKEASYQEGQKTDKETKERIFGWIDKLCDTITATRLKRSIYHDVFEPTLPQSLPIKKE